jgi:hypothetical protein
MIGKAPDWLDVLFSAEPESSKWVLCDLHLRTTKSKMSKIDRNLGSNERCAHLFVYTVSGSITPHYFRKFVKIMHDEIQLDSGIEKGEGVAGARKGGGWMLRLPLPGHSLPSIRSSMTLATTGP